MKDKLLILFCVFIAHLSFGQALPKIALELDSIFNEDQKFRQMAEGIWKTEGGSSPKMVLISKQMKEADSTNLIKVKTILDKYGWLGIDEVGERGATTLFLVIQHSDLKTQEKYLPMMKEAVKNKKARVEDLALLIDRVEVSNGRPQVYGSQVTMKDGKYAPNEILDEANVNKRRAEVGLQPLEEYLKHWGIDYKLPTK